MKGKAIFTKEEAERIEALIKQKCAAEPSNQKGIRQKIRNLGFYAKDDFGISGGYTVADFRRVVKIVGENEKSSTSNTQIQTPIDSTINSKEALDLAINFKSDVVSTLKKLGFKGFLSIEAVNEDLKVIPKTIGVYIIYSESTTPHFEVVGTGGFFKQKNPNVSMEDLIQNWVVQSTVLYIGKAGSLSGSATLYKRLKQYFDFGHGKAVGHYGGRYIWQINNPYKLKVCWLPTPNQEPREIEKELIQQFIAQFGKRPFANLKD